MNPEYRTQGKCPKCKVRHTWPERLQKFGGSICPQCGTKLERTSHLSALPVKDWPEGLKNRGSSKGMLLEGDGGRTPVKYQPSAEGILPPQQTKTA